MALCLANSLIACRGFNEYDQLVRYKWWYKHGYMSSTGQCFDIGHATRQSIAEFEDRQDKFQISQSINIKDMDSISDPETLKRFDVECSSAGVAGNGALMRLAPVPLFFYNYPSDAVEFSGVSGRITHGDDKAYDACRYYGALIVAALRGHTKDQLLDNDFYSKHEQWFGGKRLHSEIESIAKGSYKRPNGYDDGIRGKGYIVNALEAALWAFWSDDNSFEKGALNAVNLGDDTDTTAAIYGQLAGAYYGYKHLPEKWVKEVYARRFLEKLSHWIAYEGQCWQKPTETSNNDSQ
jgi:ADP-ribosylglycohydrolase